MKKLMKRKWEVAIFAMFLLVGFILNSFTPLLVSAINLEVPVSPFSSQVYSRDVRIEGTNLVIAEVIPLKTGLQNSTGITEAYNNNIDFDFAIVFYTKHISSNELNTLKMFSKNDLLTYVQNIGSDEGWDPSIGCKARITVQYNYSELLENPYYYQFCDFISTTGTILFLDSQYTAPQMELLESCWGDAYLYPYPSSRVGLKSNYQIATISNPTVNMSYTMFDNRTYYYNVRMGGTCCQSKVRVYLKRGLSSNWSFDVDFIKGNPLI